MKLAMRRVFTRCETLVLQLCSYLVALSALVGIIIALLKLDIVFAILFGLNLVSACVVKFFPRSSAKPAM